MPRMLSSRIERLERASACKQEQAAEAKERQAGADKSLERFAGKLRLMVYEPKDREARLTLEERLAIARKDAAPKPEVWAEKWDPQLACVRSQLVPVDSQAAQAVRELEIRILERDARIDEATAEELRHNIGAHFDAKQLRRIPLLDLPFPIVIDDDALAARALRKCPLRESLPLEDQLALAKQEAETERHRAESASGGLRAFCARIHESTIRDLEHKISERDRNAVGGE